MRSANHVGPAVLVMALAALPAAGQGQPAAGTAATVNGQAISEAAVQRGLINEDQLMAALAEQNNMKLVNLTEVKPSPEALTLVPETMASVYKVVPISIKDKVLTVAIGDPNNLPAMDDLRKASIEDIGLITDPKVDEANPPAKGGK